MAADIYRTREMGATELILDFHASTNSADELAGTTLCLAEPLVVAS